MRNEFVTEKGFNNLYISHYYTYNKHTFLHYHIDWPLFSPNYLWTEPSALQSEANTQTRTPAGRNNPVCTVTKDSIYKLYQGGTTSQRGQAPKSKSADRCDILA